jgi:hypothetical protein
MMRVLLGVFASCLWHLQTATGIPLPSSIQPRDAPFEDVRTRLDRNHQNKENDPGKYFHESSFSNHYDGRFADRPLNYEERQTHLRALAQTYLATMNDIGVETFLMHGTLLGWFWNQKIMPWDSDVDVMISEKSIHHLAQYYNMSVHTYVVPGQKEGREYMLEINSFYESDHVDDINMIDGRWIDTDTGL